jgi:hypothetical protein
VVTVIWVDTCEGDYSYLSRVPYSKGDFFVGDGWPRRLIHDSGDGDLGRCSTRVIALVGGESSQRRLKSGMGDKVREESDATEMRHGDEGMESRT